MKVALPNRCEPLVTPLLFGVTGFVLFPAIQWLVRETAAHSQLLHGFLVFLLTIVLLVFNRDNALARIYSLGRSATFCLVSAYAILVVAAVSGLNFLVLPAIALVCASLLFYLFGEKQRRLIISSVLCLGLFMGFVLFLPVMDWPLRSIAGDFAARGLSILGYEIGLGLAPGKAEPMLILISNGRPFHVAPECNGFGMLLSSLLMTCMLVFYKYRGTIAILCAIPAAILFGLILNALRIVLIVVIAPHFSHEAYGFIHETIGLITTYGGLALLYLGLIRLL